MHAAIATHLRIPSADVPIAADIGAELSSLAVERDFATAPAFATDVPAPSNRSDIRYTVIHLLHEPACDAIDANEFVDAEATGRAQRKHACRSHRSVRALRQQRPARIAHASATAPSSVDGDEALIDLDHR